jgi:hypothetical protein
MIQTGTIAIRRCTRELLKQVGKKGQTYDELINQLIQSKQNWHDSLDVALAKEQSSESRNTWEESSSNGSK